MLVMLQVRRKKGIPDVNNRHIFCFRLADLQIIVSKYAKSFVAGFPGAVIWGIFVTFALINNNIQAMRQTRHWMLALWLSILCTVAFASCTANDDNLPEMQPTVQRIVERGKLQVGTTGDYRPLSYRETDGNYWGFGIDMAEKIAERIGVGIEFVQTSWPTLTADVLIDPQTFDLAIGGITITDARKETMLMSDGYLVNGKTILCRAADADRYHSLGDIDKPEVRVMVNPGGLNEKFANENLTHATIIVYDKNEAIPSQVAEGSADVMITEITEAPWYVQNDPRLAAPLLNSPFTHGEIGVLMRKGQDDLLDLVNTVIAQMKAEGTLRQLCEKYGLSYGY